jgi:hypothetical protein
MMPAMVCETATIYAVYRRGKAGISLPVQFVISGRATHSDTAAAARQSVERRLVTGGDVQRP